MSTFNKYRVKGAYHYDWYETEDWYKYLVDRCVRFCKGSTIEVGCGDGLLANKLAEKGLEVLGIDTDPHAISLARSKREEGSDVVFLQRGIEDVANPDWEVLDYEYLTCLNVIEHLDKPELVRDFIRTNITKGAIITTIDYQGGSLGEDHKFEWTYEQMMDFFKEFNPKGFRYKDTEWIGVEITK